MSKLSEKELSQAAKEVFESNKDFDTVFQTTDGQCFEREDNAINHQLKLTKKGEDVRIVKASDLKAESKDQGSGSGNLKLTELQELAKTAGLPEAEWSGFKSKAEITTYLTEKGVEIK